MTGVHTLRIHYLSRRCYTLCPVVRTRCLRACPVLLFEFVTWMSIYRFPLKRVTKFYLVMPTVFSVWVSDVVGSAPFEQIKQNKKKLKNLKNRSVESHIESWKRGCCEVSHSRFSHACCAAQTNKRHWAESFLTTEKWPLLQKQNSPNWMEPECSLFWARHWFVMQS